MSALRDCLYYVHSYVLHLESVSRIRDLKTRFGLVRGVQLIW